MPSQVLQHVRAVDAGVLVAGPGIHGATPRIKLEFGHRLAEGAVGVALMSAEFDEEARAEYVYQVEGKGYVLMPRRHVGQPPGSGIADEMIE